VVRPVAKSSARETIEAILVALLLALVIRTFVVQAFKIPSGSMLPTLQIGDHLLVNKFLYGPRLEIPFTQISLGRLPGIVPRNAATSWSSSTEGSSRTSSRWWPWPARRSNAPAPSLHQRRAGDDPYATYRLGGVERASTSARTPCRRARSSRWATTATKPDSRFWGPVPLENVKGLAVIIYRSGPRAALAALGRLGKLVL
jgi:signal peptidase I